MMEDDVILKVENLSKQYRLGLVGTGTISHDLNRFLARIRGKDDPYLKIGESNDRSTKGTSEYVWALKDINFEVKRGEVLGIIGKNGAGKSTLLKILSKVTGPSTGAIKSKGRIASLLEVGTGFHPEMTGKENIFLNGAILGMTKKEIASKLDEIIEFSGCERYVDTPVKRYSSGMKVRLAFAVAAFLEPDILVVDEVLAVGDAEFQKKAIGKMQNISSQGGRTVLFVSHDMGAIQSLCSRLIVLKNGTVIFNGLTNEGIKNYLRPTFIKSFDPIEIGENIITQFNIQNSTTFKSGSDLLLTVFFKINTPVFNPFFSIIINDSRGIEALQFHSRGINFSSDFCNDLILELVVDNLNLHLGDYSIDFKFYDGKSYEFKNIASLKCVELMNFKISTNQFHKLNNSLYYNYNYNIK